MKTGLRPRPLPLPGERAAALILTLTLLALMAIIAVALAVAMRTDRASARAFLDRTKASLMDDQAVNHSIALLRQLSGSTNASWTVGPGQGYVSVGTNSRAMTSAVVLSSGLGTGKADPNLNLAPFATPGHRAIAPSGPAMRVQWIHVRQDGSLDTAATPAVSATNPVVGRYGFWVDAESARVDWNTAYKRTSKDAASASAPLSPDNIDLAALDSFAANSSFADAVHAFVRNSRFFDSPDDVRSADTNNDAALLAALNANRFATTHWSHDPETTYWGAPRIVLTTRSKWSGGRPFLDILRNPDTDDPGLLDNIDWNRKFIPLMKTLTAELSRTDWPVGPSGDSFAAKFFNVAAYPNPAQARQYLSAQLALHIIDYVRAKESAQAVVQRVTGTLDNSGNFARTWNDVAGDFSSHSRQVHITEMGAWISPTPLASDPFQYSGTFYLEVHLPRNYGLASYDLTQLAALVVWDTQWYDANYKLGAPVAFTSANTKVNGAPGTVLNAGGYAVAAIPFTYNPSSRPYWASPSRPSTLTLKAYLLPANHLDPGYNIDAAPIITTYNNGTSGTVSYRVDPANVLPDQITTVETDDPRINGDNRDWTQRAAGTGNTLGSVNGVSTLGHAPSTTLPYSQAPQDRDGSGLLTDVGLTMPAPAGAAANPDGMVHSVAELGCVVTGSQGEYGSGAGQPRSVPWRSLRFQPTTGSETLPDWALLDLFSAPANTAAQNTAAVLSPSSATATSVHGRIDLNGLIAPFEPGVSLLRTAPLAALLNGVALSGAATPAAVATNLYRRTLAEDVKRYDGNANAYS
ncbi:MAG TPA: hypothetical protein VIM58_01395, partial [Candidatus Methylacidiphilales bacterium]